MNSFERKWKYGQELSVQREFELRCVKYISQSFCSSENEHIFRLSSARCHFSTVIALCMAGLWWDCLNFLASIYWLLALVEGYGFVHLSFRNLVNLQFEALIFPANHSAVYYRFYHKLISFIVAKNHIQKNVEILILYILSFT